MTRLKIFEEIKHDWIDRLNLMEDMHFCDLDHKDCGELSMVLEECISKKEVTDAIKKSVEPVGCKINLRVFREELGLE